MLSRPFAVKLRQLRLPSAAGAAAFGVVALLGPAAGAQESSAPNAGVRKPDRWVTLSAGGFIYDIAGDGTLPVFGLRASRSLSRVFLVEAGGTVSHSRIRPNWLAPGEQGDASGNPVARVSTLGGLDVGVQAQAPLRFVQPYVGIATGFFARLDRGTNGEQSLSSSQHLLTGVRIPVHRRVGLRAEFRYRVDGDSQGPSHNFEQTLGLALRW